MGNAIGLYIRLSSEDNKVGSYSIENQKRALHQYVDTRDWSAEMEVLEFVDNGYSGTNFERPAVQELLGLVQEGKICCIIVKDFTRFGRNSIEVGYFMEMVFPLYGVRFISINDEFDSAQFHGDTGGINVAFKYLISEFYSRDLSQKYTSAKYVKFRRGEYQSRICPYGYQKSADGRMEPDPETAENVKFIFDMATTGRNTTDIIKALYGRRVPTPGEYKASRGQCYHDISRAHGIWHRSTILNILHLCSVPIPYILRFSSSLLHYTAFFFSCVGSYLFFAYGWQKTSEDGKVEGITFHITGNGIDQTVTTNSRGEVQIDSLQPGEYTVTEQMAGDYVPQEPQKVTVQAGQTATVSFNNSLQKGSLTVTKNSEDGLNSGVRFHLFGTSSMGETVDLYATTNGGVYRYLINNAPFTSYVKVIKTDAETGKAIPYAGAGFQIYDPNGQLVTMQFTYPAVTVIDTFYTTTDGTLITSEVLPYGTGYSLVEVQAPYGYVLNSEPVYFDITPDNSTEESAVTVVEVERPNMPQKGKISITKLGEAFSSVTALGGAAADEDGNEVEFPVSYQPVYEEKQLAGAVYEVTAAEDIVTPDGTLRYESGEVVATLTTAQDSPVATEPLYLGKYQVREIEAPFGTVLDTESHLVELTYAGQEVEITETSTTLHDDRQKIKISLNKVLEQDERFQLGMNGEITTVQFGLYASEDITAADGSVIPADGLIETINCAEDGSVVFVTDLPLGSYHVKEISTDKHYTLPDTVYPVVFEYAGQDVALVEVALNDGEPITNELIYGSIKGLKIDRENQETIAGALFGLFRPDVLQFTSDTAILTATSDEEGVFSFENVPLGNWIVRELQPAEGYLPNTDIHHVQVERDEQLIEITVVNDKVPELGTTASIGGEKEVNATEVFTLEDVVEYTHLVPGKEYTVKGVLMDKAADEPLKINGAEVRSETTFTPENPSGTVTVVFEFDSKYIKADTDIVVFENLYQDGRELAVHADLEDESQTVTIHVPEIGTQATIGEEKEVTIDGPVTIEDVVSYKNLTPGKEYSVYGILMDKNTGEALKVGGEEIHAESTFTPETANGETVVQFTFDTTGLVDSTEIVAFESLSREGIELAAHANIEDPAQTVKVTVTGPRIGTKATVDGKKEVSGEGLITIEDTVSYKGLTAGKEYKLTGTLMNKTTGEPFKLNGEEIHAETTFTPESAEGEVVVSFPFDTSWVTETTDIVVFEKLSLNGKEIAVHEDIGDKEQTVTIVVTRPEIGTTATIGGKKEAAPSKEITIDDVVSYKNLTPGTEYKLVGVLMDKATGNPFKVGDKEIKAETVFTPEKADGETVVKFTFDGSGITQTTELVMFETLYQGEVKIAAHEDINDEGQTVKIVPVTPGKPTTPNPGNPQTGDRSIMGFWIGLGAVALGGLVSGIIMYSRKRKEQDGE